MKFIRQKQRRNFFRELQAQTYQSRRFGNPYFPKKGKSLPIVYAVAGTIFGLVVALTSFFFTSSTFAIRAVRVEGTESIPSRAIIDIANDCLDERRLLIFSASNKFLLNTKKLTTNLSRAFTFDNLEIEIEGTDLVIRVVERVSTFVWSSDDKLYLVDRSGIVIRQISQEEYERVAVLPAVQGPVREGESLPAEETLLRFVDTASQETEIGNSVLKSQEIEAVFGFLEELERLEIRIREIEIDRTMGLWMGAVTSVGFKIFFDPATDPKTQVARLEAVLRDSVPDPGILEYIDLRFEDHIYFK